MATWRWVAYGWWKGLREKERLSEEERAVRERERERERKRLVRKRET